MHRTCIDLKGTQGTSQVFDPLFLSGEDDHFLEVLALQGQLHEPGFLSLIETRTHLMDRLRRTRDSYLHLHRIMHDRFRHLTNLRRHGSGEHNRLTVGRQFANDGHDVVIESHVEHSVCLVEDEILDAGEIDVVYIHLAEESSRGGDDHVGTALQSRHLRTPCPIILTAVDSYGREGYVKTEPLHLLVYLLRQLTRRRHDDGVQFVGIMVIVGEVSE